MNRFHDLVPPPSKRIKLGVLPFARKLRKTIGKRIKLGVLPFANKLRKTIDLEPEILAFKKPLRPCGKFEYKGSCFSCDLAKWKYVVEGIGSGDNGPGIGSEGRVRG
jgi:hypothetical protein